MSVQTTYDEKRDELKGDLKSCLEKARELLDQSIYGYDDMESDYAINLYKIISEAVDAV